MFKAGFNKYACTGDTITCDVDGFTATARIYQDDCTDAPDERQDGFWPSLDPKSAGYIGAKSERTLQRRMAQAKRVMEAWKANEWFYCGVAVTIEKGDVTLTGRYENALWGIECNYPKSDNSYLRDVANELLPEALAQAKAKLETLKAD